MSLQFLVTVVSSANSPPWRQTTASLLQPFTGKLQFLVPCQRNCCCCLFFYCPLSSEGNTSNGAACQGANSSFLLFRQLRWREIARRRRGETNLIYEAARRRSSTCGWNQRLGVDKDMSSGKLFFKARSLTKKKKNGPRANIIKRILTVIDSGFIRCLLERLKANVLVGRNCFQTVVGGRWGVGGGVETRYLQTLSTFFPFKAASTVNVTHGSQLLRRPAHRVDSE